MSSRNEQRSALFKSRPRRTKTFDFDGQTYTMKEPTLAERDEMIVLARKADKEAQIAAFERFAVRRLLVDSDGERLIEDADMKSLDQLPIEFFDAATSLAKKLMNPDEKEAKEVEKNSEGTPSDS